MKLLRGGKQLLKIYFFSDGGPEIFVLQKSNLVRKCRSQSPGVLTIPSERESHAAFTAARKIAFNIKSIYCVMQHEAEFEGIRH